jgi:hypothetical protein
MARVLLAALTAALLAGCGTTDDQPSKDKVLAALHTLGANPDTVHAQTVVARSPGTGQLSRQVLLLVPVPDAPGYRIVDAQGEIFTSYDEFLTTNTLPDQPGPG